MIEIPVTIRTMADRAAASIRPPVSALFDAFMGSLEPLVRRVVGRSWHVAVAEPETIALYAVRDGKAGAPLRLRAGETAPDAARRGALHLRLPPEQFLRRTLRLPEAGRGYLPSIIEHRLERLTPWRSERVLYGFQADETAAADGTIAVEILATSMDLAGLPLARLEAAGLVPTALGSAAEPLEAPLRFDLYRSRPEAADNRLRASVARITAIVFGVLAVTFLASAWLASSAEADLQASEERLAALRGRLDPRGGPRTSRAGALIEAKRPETATIVLIDRLSRVLPDDTVLRELDIDPAKVRIVGRSTDAPALIPLIEADGGFRNPRFAAPVIRDAERRDAFEIVAARTTAPESAR